MRKGLKAQQHQQQQQPLQPMQPPSKPTKLPQQPQQQQPQQQQRDRLKTTCTVSARMRQVVDQMLTCDAEQYAMAMQQTTIFAFKSQQSELVLSFLQEMRRENCTLYQNKEALLQLVSEAYDKTQALFAVH